MLRNLLLAGAALALLAAPALAQDSLAPAGRWTAPRSGAASTPPMGWNAWNAFRTEVDEDKVMGSAQALVDTGLSKLGYVYVNLDDGWWLKRRQADGRLVIRTALFPSAAAPGGETSFKPFVDRLHAMGLKAGLYTDVGRNACSQAWDLKSPNLPVGTALEREVGLEGHLEQDIGLFFSEWGFDYLKVDACGLAEYGPQAPLVSKLGYRPRPVLIPRKTPQQDRSGEIEQLYRQVAAAIGKASPDGDHVFSICTWGRGDVRAWGGQVGNLWRTSPDINGKWPAMLRSFDSVATRALYARPGAWNDPDMLFVGGGEFDQNHLTEARSHFSLWAMSSAPLLIGYDLRGAPKALLDIWGNADLVAVNQDPLGNQAVLVHHEGDVQVLLKTLSGGRKVVALFNRSAEPAAVTLTAEQLKLSPDAPVALRDLWTKTSAQGFTGQASFDLAPHETKVFEVAGAPLVKDGVLLSEIPARIHVAQESFWPAPEDGFEGPAGPAGRTGGAQADFSPYRTALSVGGQVFLHGLGLLANSRLEVRSAGEFARFSASVGVDDASTSRAGTVRFLVYGDGRLLAQSKPMRAGAKPAQLTASIKGVQVVELVAKASDGAAPAAATWGQARMIR
ncbi:NPCBM/NEW2 domain-containing protein [Caulobacter endophyticus]|nr:NPCBM/NEW2 domain-containing protein [Caulobacter endophyticus]MDG2528149.1 NPCBM/NEW2 domain-containing protein [Caulobacter endophyticus]